MRWLGVDPGPTKIAYTVLSIQGRSAIWVESDIIAASDYTQLAHIAKRLGCERGVVEKPTAIRGDFNRGMAQILALARDLIATAVVAGQCGSLLDGIVGAFYITSNLARKTACGDAYAKDDAVKAAVFGTVNDWPQTRVTGRQANNVHTRDAALAILAMETISVRR